MGHQYTNYVSFKFFKGMYLKKKAVTVEGVSWYSTVALVVPWIASAGGLGHARDLIRANDGSISIKTKLM